MIEELTSNQWFLICGIPLLGAVLGYGVRVLYTLLSYGNRPNSQWGLAHYSRRHLAPLIYQQCIHEHLSTAQLYEHFGPERMVKQIVKHLRPRLDTIIDETMEQNHDIFWENLPITVKNRFYGRAHKILPQVIDNIVEDIGDNIDRLATLKNISTHNLLHNPYSVAQTLRLLDESHPKQKTLLSILSGYALGILVLVGWLLIDHWAVLLAGFAIIAAGSFFTVHAYQRGQLSDAEALADLLTTHALSPQLTLTLLLTKERSRFARSLIKKHAAPMIDRASLRTFTQLTIGPSGYANVKQQLSHNIYKEYFSAIKEPRFIAMQEAQVRKHLLAHIALSHDQAKRMLAPLRKRQLQSLLPISLLLGSLTGLLAQGIIYTLG